MVLKSLPSRIALAIDMKLKEVEKVLYFEALSLLARVNNFKKRQLITEEALLKQNLVKTHFLLELEAKPLEKF